MKPLRRHGVRRSRKSAGSGEFRGESDGQNEFEGLAGRRGVSQERVAGTCRNRSRPRKGEQGLVQFPGGWHSLG